MKTLAVAALAFLCLGATASGRVVENGSLRNFVLGRCPSCAYDNWVSHVSEGLARPGYNDYGPPFFDPQRNGFGSCTLIPSGQAGDRILNAWRTAFAACVNADWNVVDSVLAANAASWRYELVEFHDNELGRTFFLLREQLDSSYFDPNVDSIATDDVTGSFRNGWGLFVFSPAAMFARLVIEMPHPEDDFAALPVGLDLFVRTDARAMLIAGAGREVRWDTTYGLYSNSISLSDPSRNCRLPFAVCHEVLFNMLDGGPTQPLVTVQMHSYDTQLHTGVRDVHASAFSDDVQPNPPLRDRAEHRDLIHFLGRFPLQGLPGRPDITRRVDQYVSLYSSPAYAFYSPTDTLPILSSSDITGYGANCQGVYSHRAHHVGVDPENFLHIEVDEYPSGLPMPENWAAWLLGPQPSLETFALLRAYYAPFVAALDSALRAAFLERDVTAPVAVTLDQVIHVAADSLVLRWSPAAADRFFDTYLLYYDTTAITDLSPYFTRTSPRLSALQDFMTTSVLLTGLPLPVGRYRFALGSRDIFGNAAPRSNTRGVTGGTVAFRLPDPYIGCGAACRETVLYLTFSESGFVNGQMFVVLPPQLEAAWPPGEQMFNAIPASNAAANLIFSAARRVGGARSDTLEINVQWAPPYSDGNATRYIAALPVRAPSPLATGSLLITGLDSTIFYSDIIPHINEFDVGPATLYNDCSAPSASLVYSTPPSCAFGSAGALAGRMRISILRGSTPVNSPLCSAFVEVNGDSARRLLLFNTPQAGNYVHNSFPATADAPLLWSFLNEGCNSLIVRAYDQECNTGTSSALTVVKDTTPPGLVVSHTAPGFCYNNQSGSQHYGGSLLDDHLAIYTFLGGGACSASSGTLDIVHGTNRFRAATLPPDVSSYPATDAEALALWTWMLTQVPPHANGELYPFGVEVRDCAGNVALGSFTLCLDLTPPVNTVTFLDARPTDMGVWLSWEWTPLPTDAVSMEIWRSAYTGDYPRYALNRWSNLADTANYPTSYPPPGFIKIVEQERAQGFRAREYRTPNGRGEIILGGPDSSYWLDQDAQWFDEHEQRDIYRYITFVCDAAGNPSRVTAYTLNGNADRSTNYWLGDFSRDVTTDPNGSSGRVNTADLSLLSTIYFTTVPPTAGWYDIGPENGENGYGRGLPTPDGFVNFFDLVAFSMNFGVAGPRTFVTMPPPRGRLPDDRVLPAVALVRTSRGAIRIGDMLTLAVVLTGNDSSVVKAAEAHVLFDPRVLEIVSVSAAPLPVTGGEAFACAKPAYAQPGRIGIAAAALGDSARIAGNPILAEIVLRWTNIHAESTSITLAESRLCVDDGAMLMARPNALELEAAGAIPERFALHANYPNPFNAQTHIRFDLPQAAQVELAIYNALGQRVAVLVNDLLPAGIHRITWDGSAGAGPAPSGVYFCRLRAGSFADMRKLVLLR